MNRFLSWDEIKLKGLLFAFAMAGFAATDAIVYFARRAGVKSDLWIAGLAAVPLVALGLIVRRIVNKDEDWGEPIKRIHGAVIIPVILGVIPVQAFIKGDYAWGTGMLLALLAASAAILLFGKDPVPDEVKAQHLVTGKGVENDDPQPNGDHASVKSSSNV